MHGRLGIEFEIAVRLARPFPPEDGVPTLEHAAACVDAACPALELVDDRNADYGTLDAPSLIADNAWNAGVVLGTWQTLPDDLAQRRGSVFLDGLRIDDGAVGDALGNPFDAVVWLAAELARRKQSLPTGGLVMTGSIVKTRFPSIGEHWRYVVDGLEDVQVHCARSAEPSDSDRTLHTDGEPASTETE